MKCYSSVEQREVKCSLSALFAFSVSHTHTHTHTHNTPYIWYTSSSGSPDIVTAGPLLSRCSIITAVIMTAEVEMTVHHYYCC